MAAVDNLPITILVVDDDARLGTLLQQFLTREGYVVHLAADTAQARELLANQSITGIILDVMLPNETGLEFASAIRAGNVAKAADDLPILLLTARDAPQERVAGLESGADDYLAKPFEPRELALRLARLVRGYRQPASSLSLGAYELQRHSGIVTHRQNGVQLDLTAAERELLRLLAAANGQPVDRDTLAQAGGLQVQSPRTVDVQLTRLRKKLEPKPATPRYLLTVRSQGYALRGD